MSRKRFTNSLFLGSSDKAVDLKGHFYSAKMTLGVVSGDLRIDRSAHQTTRFLPLSMSALNRPLGTELCGDVYRTVESRLASSREMMDVEAACRVRSYKPSPPWTTACVHRPHSLDRCWSQSSSGVWSWCMGWCRAASQPERGHILLMPHQSRREPASPRRASCLISRGLLKRK